MYFGYRQRNLTSKFQVKGRNLLRTYSLEVKDITLGTCL